ncbi:glycosyltransferase family 2 protein [Ensifer adhaerens]|uniref:glycosyltransferase family 2 protein n=1 Tax=Ensifer canadensis TaxID=555315 RepID=UPI00148F9055|nr:glycosyltransferase family A protein [Ensifer canadensis]NOV15866.1 glycosyltransferase family 2 protein [Ensifer canadensis]
MATESVLKFRRSPARVIERSSERFGIVLAKLYRGIDRRGLLSDFIADPRTSLLGVVPKWLIRACFCRQDGPSVSVIVATRNNAATIHGALQSLLDQTHANLEIIVIDDASDDNSLDIVRSIVRRDHRVKLVSNKNQLGTGRSRNLGLKMATGDYVTFQDGDDFSLPTRIASQLTVFSKFSGKTLSLCNYVRVDPNGNSLEINDRRVMKCIISMMFPRTEVLERVGFFVDGTVSEDADYYERIKIAFGSSCEVLTFRTLYQALFRPNSSFFGQMAIKTIDKGRVTYDAPPTVSGAHENIKRRHEMMREGKISCRVEFPD